jgi:hypothetical protein
MVRTACKNTTYSTTALIVYTEVYLVDAAVALQTCTLVHSWLLLQVCSNFRLSSYYFKPKREEMLILLHLYAVLSATAAQQRSAFSILYSTVSMSTMHYTCLSLLC